MTARKKTARQIANHEKRVSDAGVALRLFTAIEIVIQIAQSLELEKKDVIFMLNEQWTKK